MDSDLALSSIRRISFAGAVAVLAIALAVAPGASRAATNDIATDFGWFPTSPTPGQVVLFTASATAPSGVAVKNYDWDLDGDGSIDAHGKTAIWSYPAPGSVSVRLRVKGNGNHRGEAVQAVSVRAAGGGGGGRAPRPPVASFTVAPAAPVVNQPVLFTSTSSDPDGAVNDQVWDLNGDGNYDNGGGTTALRTFGDAGQYVVGLRVTDTAGLVSFDSQTVTVVSAPGMPISTAKSGPRLLSPFPIVRIAGRVTRRGTRVRILRVKAPLGTKVSVRCAGRSCPFQKQVLAVPTGSKKVAAVSVRVRRLERLLRPGVRVRVYVTKPGAIGKYTKFRFRAGNAPVRTDSCLMPGTWAPAECPAF